MNKKVAIGALVPMGIFFIVGLVLIFSSSSIGLKAGDNYAKLGNGFYGNTQYEHVVNGTTTAYQMGGLAISLVGGFGLLIGGHALYKEMWSTSP